MSKDLWMMEYERISEDFVSGESDENDVRRRLRALGFDPSEIDDHIDALYEDIGAV